MIEHRLIERMIDLMERALRKAEREKRIDARFVDAAAHFIRAYADQCHHGKEEDILFREIEKKSISEGHKKIMDELIEEHKRGRETTARLVEANERYKKGDKVALSDLIECIESLVDFYPGHIEKEDNHFFIPVMGYFSGDEKEAMLREGYEFDSSLIHREYDDMISTWEESVSEKDQ
jgi:hemerythrin-like domain-containing protein